MNTPPRSPTSPNWSTDLDEAQAVILQLRADLHREQDRFEMTAEDRDFYRDQANGFARC